MKQKTLAALLYVALAIFSAAVLLALFWIAPEVGQALAQENPNLAWAYWPWLSLLWTVGGLLLVIVGFCVAIVRNIARGAAFSCANAKHFACIAWIAAGDAVLFLAGNLVLGEASAPLVFLGSIFCTFLGLAVSVGAATLSHLCGKAADLQKKEELTI